MTAAQIAPSARLTTTRAGEEAPRLAYIDNIRVAVIAVVVIHHAAQAYASVGSGWAIVNPTQTALLRPFLAVNAAFGMGLMFLLAGYFTPQAYERRGVRGLLHGRLVRLGWPTLIVSLGLFLPYTYLSQPAGTPFGAFLLTYLPQPQVGHMWFASLLIACTLGYAAWRGLHGPGPAPASAMAEPPGHLAILGFALWLGVVTFLVRLVFPLDRWISPLPFLWFEPARLPQYLSLFVLGCAASRRDWLRRLPRRTGETWLAIGLGAAGLPYITMLLGERLPPALVLAPASGPGPDATLWTLVETLVCVGLAIGLLTLFRDRVDRPSPLLAQLSAASYAVYVTHLLPVMGLQLALVGLAIPPLLKFLLVALAALPLSFGLAFLLRRLPLIAPMLA